MLIKETQSLTICNFGITAINKWKYIAIFAIPGKIALSIYILHYHIALCTYVCVSGGINVSFSENFAYTLNEWSLINELGTACAILDPKAMLVVWLNILVSTVD